MEIPYRRAHKEAQTCCFGADRLHIESGNVSADSLTRTPTLPQPPTSWNDTRAKWRSGEFYQSLSPRAMSELESLAAPFYYKKNAILFAEKQQPSSILFLLEGSVKLTINSIEGRRFTLAIATPGDVLGLVAVVSGCPHEITVVAQSPCAVASLPRQSFLDFLLHHPIAWQNSASLLSAEYKRGCAQLRHFGMA